MVFKVRIMHPNDPPMILHLPVIPQIGYFLPEASAA